MKILKAPDTQWSFKCTCSNCTAELLIEKQDVKYRADSDQRTGESWETWSAICASCRHGINIPSDSIPKAVKSEIKDGRIPKPYSSGTDFRDGPFEDFYDK